MVYLAAIIILSVAMSLFVVNADNLYDYETWMHKHKERQK